MGGHPAAYIRAFEPARDGHALRGLGHRWVRSADLVALLWVLRQMFDRCGSVEAFFVEGYDPAAADIGPALESFSTRARALDLRTPGVCYFFPRPSSGSACKRLNLFLRWMVRRDGLDLGVWSRVSPRALVVPLDTHVIRVGRCLRLTRHASPGWAMAQDITAALRRLDADDPVKYDFALCHLGMMNACGFNRGRTGRGKAQAALDGRCPLRGVCRPRRARTPRRSRPPFARR
jgi:uncharacterized protein (TIGR02757 family)